MSDDIEFYVTLPSNDTSLPADRQFPNSFEVRLPSPINLTTQYQVAIFEMFYNVKQATTEETIDGVNVITGGGITNDLFVYCNLIEAQIVGSSQVRLLKHIGNNEIDKTQVFRATEPLQFVNVIAKHITEISITIADQQGALVPLQGTTTIILAFRKKPY